MGKEAKRTREKKTNKKTTEEKPKKDVVKDNNNKYSSLNKILANKKARIIIPIIVLLVILGPILFSLNLDVVDLSSASESKSKAELFIEYGNVQVKTEGKSWTKAENGTLLYQSDSVKTADDTSAYIVFFESSIIWLDSNTEVTMKEIIDDDETIISIEQDAGRTWSTVSKISGIDSYSVETPSTIASVRGTSFDFYMLPNGTTIISVGFGIVNITRIDKGAIVDSISVEQNNTVIIYPDKFDVPLDKEPIKKDEWILKFLEKDIQALEKEKQIIYDRIKQYIPQLQERYNITEEEIDALIEGYLLGYWDIPSDAPDWILDLFKFS